MRFGNSTSIKALLRQVENKTEEELTGLAKKNGMPTPLPLVTGIKPGFRSILRATYDSRERNPNYMATFFPSYRTDFGWCSLVIPMVEFEDKYVKGLLHKLLFFFFFEAKLVIFGHPPPNIFFLLPPPFFFSSNDRFQDDSFQTLREKRVPYASRGAKLGKVGGLRLLVDAEVYDYSYGSHAAEGFQVAVVPHRDIPLMFLDEIQVRPGSLTNIIIRPTLTK